MGSIRHPFTRQIIGCWIGGNPYLTIKGTVQRKLTGVENRLK